MFAILNILTIKHLTMTAKIVYISDCIFGTSGFAPIKTEQNDCFCDKEMLQCIKGIVENTMVAVAGYSFAGNREY